MIRAHVLICGGTGCTSSGSKTLQEAFNKSLAQYGLTEEIKMVQTGCFGLCALGPIVIVYPDGTFYSRVTADDVNEIVEEHLLKGRIVERLVYRDAETDEIVEQQTANVSLSDTKFYKSQKRIVLRNCGVIDPDNIEEYIAMDGYAALGKVLTEMTPEEVIKVVSDSGLRGRGGGGFPTGRKWALCAHMCMAILRQLGAIRLPGEPRPESAAEGSHLLSYLLPAVGHIYEQFVRECCYNTMYVPYYAHACGRSPRQVGSVILSTYDQGPDARFYRLKSFDPSMRDPEKQGDIRERMIDDFAAYATIRGEQMTDVYWYNLFNDMNTARSQRNEMAHELADVRVAEIFARAFLLEQPGEPSLLRRLLMCRWVATNFPRL